MKDERRKVLLVGPIGSNPLATARQIADECRLYQGREHEQSYVYRVAGVSVPETKQANPRASFRAPHHTCGVPSFEGMLRGHIWRPGELHLAHGGVLYLDLVTEFRPVVLQAIERAWTRGYTSQASRTVEGIEGEASHSMNYVYAPTYFTLVMSTTPCPCGYRGATDGAVVVQCTCSERQIERWFARIRTLTEGAERIELSRPNLRGVTP